MSNSNKIKSLVPVGLIALCIVPVVAGIVRLRQISIGILTEENARFLASPWPVGIHIVGASIFCVLGVFQFIPNFRSRWIQWHRVMGRILVICGLLASTTGLWMTQFYPLVAFDGVVLYWVRLIVGVTMTLSLVFAIRTVRRREIMAHRAWMIRAYALGMGAGTQVITHIPWFLFPTIQCETSRTIFMVAGWGINMVIAELIIGTRVITSER